MPGRASKWLWTSVTGVLLTGAGVSGYFAVERPPPAPRVGLQCSLADVQFGEVGQGEYLVGTFDITNFYPDPIQIHDVHTGCSCRTATASRKHLGPGDQSVLTITWAVGARRGVTGETIWVTHSIPGEAALGWLPIRLHATVAPDIQYEPKQIEFRLGRAESK
ncbi:MAG TPA: DUF1573 domain-containing protein [Urbifossiella sp.]|nr:DUF1573 domain-containing protein [Urbifossiella sp.]